MKTRHAFFSLLVGAALNAAEPAAAPAAPAEAAPAVATPSDAAPSPTLSLPAVAPATGGTTVPGSVLSRLRLPPAAQKTKEGIKPPPLSPRFIQIRDRIGELLETRSAPPPAINPAHNPFRNVGAAPVPVAVIPADGGAPVEVAAPSATEEELLKQAAALVRVSGKAEREGRTILIINDKFCREGDVIRVTVRGQTLFLRLNKITRTNFTLTLNTAETIVSY